MLAWLQPTRPGAVCRRALPGLQLPGGRGPLLRPQSASLPGFKFGRYHHLDEAVDPETIDREPAYQTRAMLRQFAERYAQLVPPDDGAAGLHQFTNARTSTSSWTCTGDARVVSFALLRPWLQVQQRRRRDHGRPGGAARPATTSACSRSRASPTAVSCSAFVSSRELRAGEITGSGRRRRLLL